MISNFKFQISNLNVKIEGKEIIKNFSLEIQRGELHVLMGPNGSGKSTLARAIASPVIFLGFQNPVTVPGVNFVTFMRLAFNRRHPGTRHGRVIGSSKTKDAIGSPAGGLQHDTLGPVEFYKYLKTQAKLLDIPEEWLSRGVNEGFSGGEKKRMEMLQALVLQPKFAILDEPDTGTDIDSLKIIAKAIKILLKNNTGILLITHNPKILKFLKVNFVHIIKNGVLVKSGNKNLIKIIEKEGYAKF